MTLTATRGDKRYRKEILLPGVYPRGKMKVTCNNGVVEIKCAISDLCPSDPARRNGRPSGSSSKSPKPLGKTWAAPWRGWGPRTWSA